MKNKKNILAYPKNINFEFLGLEFMRLHQHGQGIISRSKCFLLEYPSKLLFPRYQMLSRSVRNQS